MFADRVRQRASVFAPGTVIGFDANDHTAKARVRVRDGSVQVVTCTVQPAAPHRIRATTTIGLIPSALTPRLPADFTGYPELAGRGAGARLIVFSGLPGAGKSTLAEAAGRQLRVPVFAVDWLLGSLTPFGGYHLDEGFPIPNATPAGPGWRGGTRCEGGESHRPFRIKSLVPLGRRDGVKMAGAAGRRLAGVAGGLRPGLSSLRGFRARGAGAAGGCAVVRPPADVVDLWRAGPRDEV